VPTRRRYDGYVLYLSNLFTLRLARQVGAATSETLDQASVLFPLVENETYRLTLRATGAVSVKLEGTLVALAGTSETVLASVSADDDSEGNYPTGTVGFSSNGSAKLSYDDFSRVALD
jgi:hypothetical protein